MKKILLIIAVWLHAFSAKAQFIKAELEVSGLTCSMCSLSTQKSLKTLDFIEAIKPDLNKNIFYITFKEGKTVSLDAMKDKVKAAGFSVSRLTAIYRFNEPQNDAQFTYDGSVYRFLDAKSASLNGEKRLTVLDKDFVSSKTFKRFSVGVTDPSYLTGKNDKHQRVYHISLS